MADVTVGPWPNSGIPLPVMPQDMTEQELVDAGFGEPVAEHRPRADLCPQWCHPCSLLKNPWGRYDWMPWCMAGALDNTGDGCYCEREEEESNKEIEHGNESDEGR